MKKVNCDLGFFPHRATEIAEYKFVTTKRYYVCEKHKQETIKQKELIDFRTPSLSGDLSFRPIED